MRKIGFDPGLIRPHFFNRISAMDINEGHCFEWAYVAFRLFSGVTLWSTTQDGVHAFIRCKGRFYDSEALAGKVGYMELPCLASLSTNTGWETGSEEFSFDEFFDRWQDCDFCPRIWDDKIDLFLKRRQRKLEEQIYKKTG